MEYISSGLFRNVLGGVSPFNLTEYAYSLSKATGISIQFKAFPSDCAAGAMVDTARRIIYLPQLDYTKRFDFDQFRKIKAYLNHECAHLLFPDTSYMVPPSNNDDLNIRQIAMMIDDLRIETLLGLEYRGIKEDFKFLIDRVWSDRIIMEKSKDFSESNPGDFTKDLMGSFYWCMQQQYRKARLDVEGGSFWPVETMLPFLEKEVYPLLDPFLTSRDPAWVISEKIWELIKQYFLKPSMPLEESEDDEGDEASEEDEGSSGVEKKSEKSDSSKSDSDTSKKDSEEESDNDSDESDEDLGEDDKASEGENGDSDEDFDDDSDDVSDDSDEDFDDDSDADSDDTSSKGSSEEDSEDDTEINSKHDSESSGSHGKGSSSKDSEESSDDSSEGTSQDNDAESDSPSSDSEGDEETEEAPGQDFDQEDGDSSGDGGMEDYEEDTNEYSSSNGETSTDNPSEAADALPGKGYDGDLGEIPDIDYSKIVHSILVHYLESRGNSTYVGKCHDNEYDIMESLFNRTHYMNRAEELFGYLTKEYSLLIQRSKTLFNRVLLTEMQSRELISFSGKFVSRRAAHILAKPNNPRVFSQKVVHEDVGFDISILLDMSGSMGYLRPLYEGEDTTKKYYADASTFAKVYPVMFTLANSLMDIPNVNLEILGFTADNVLRPNTTTKYSSYISEEDRGANTIYVIKPFNELDLTSRLVRLTGLCMSSSLFQQNFDIGALKIAASRLQRFSVLTGNRRLLIVLSDGEPASSHTYGMQSTKLVIEELEQVLNIFGIGLGTQAVEALYTNSVVVNDLNHDLLEVIIHRLCQFIMHGK
jgi:cobalamin biosynthesis protein CobT